MAPEMLLKSVSHLTNALAHTFTTAAKNVLDTDIHLLPCGN
jgi:hypothetical protein